LSGAAIIALATARLAMALFVGAMIAVAHKILVLARSRGT
jgi:hypothetical protein